MEKITGFRWFNLISWGVTAVLVACLLGFTYLRITAPRSAAAAPVAQATGTAVRAASPNPVQNISFMQLPAILRKLTLKTIIPQRPRYGVITTTVQRGDSISALAKEFSIKPDTLLFANYDTLQDNPDGLRAGQDLHVPPTDGIVYQWKNGDTFDKIAAKYKAVVDDILNWPGNNIDLTAPTIQAGQLVVIPGGTRDSLAQVLQTVGAGGSTSAGGCAPGPASRGFFAWPAASHVLSGNDYSAGHPGIDIAVSEGENVYAADNGVVTMSLDGWNYGYGNVIEIDHGNGFVTLYAHLSQRNVGKCDAVGAGQVIGLAGNTGNSFGTHLHFEIRKGGVHVNPWDYLSP